MKGQLTYRKARKLNAIFLLLLLATEPATNGEGSGRPQNGDQGRGRSPEYFEEKLREFEREQFRF